MIEAYQGAFMEEDGTTEDSTAGLGSNAAGPTFGNSPSNSTTKHGLTCNIICENEEEEEGDEQLPPRRTDLPFHSSHDEYVVKCSRRLLYVFYGCGTIFAAIILWQIISQHKKKHVIAWSVGAIFVGIAVPFSLHDIHMHTMHVSTQVMQQ